MTGHKQKPNQGQSCTIQIRPKSCYVHVAMGSGLLFLFTSFSQNIIRDVQSNLVCSALSRKLLFCWQLLNKDPTRIHLQVTDWIFSTLTSPFWSIFADEINPHIQTCQTDRSTILLVQSLLVKIYLLTFHRWFTLNSCVKDIKSTGYQCGCLPLSHTHLKLIWHTWQ